MDSNVATKLHVMCSFLVENVKDFCMSSTHITVRFNGIVKLAHQQMFSLASDLNLEKKTCLDPSKVQMLEVT